MMDGKMILFLVLRPCCAGAEIGLGVQRSFSGFLLRALLAIVPPVMSLRITAIILVLAFSTFLTRAQQSEAELLRKQLKEANDKFERALEEHKAIIQQLNRRLEALESQARAATNP